LQVKLQRRLSHGLQGLASYTYAHSIDIASSDANHYYNTAQAIGDARADRGDSDFDIRHAFTAGLTYDVPAPAQDGVAKALLGGWSLSAFLYARSAPPVNVFGPISFAAGTAVRYRPHVNPGVPLEIFGAQYPGGKMFNKGAV